MRILALFLILLLSACGGKEYITVEKPVPVYVEKRVECPSKEERARLKAARPTPLREQPKPSDPVERSAKANAQLGKYEAEGGYADQVDAALDRCQAD